MPAKLIVLIVSRVHENILFVFPIAWLAFVFQNDLFMSCNELSSAVNGDMMAMLMEVLMLAL